MQQVTVGSSLSVWFLHPLHNFFSPCPEYCPSGSFKYNFPRVLRIECRPSCTPSSFCIFWRIRSVKPSTVKSYQSSRCFTTLAPPSLFFSFEASKPSGDRREDHLEIRKPRKRKNSNSNQRNCTLSKKLVWNVRSFLISHHIQ